MHPQLRVFTGSGPASPTSPQMTMTVGEFCRILAHASSSDRTWLQDFERDEVWVSEDLFVVLQAYWNMESAA